MKYSLRFSEAVKLDKDEDSRGSVIQDLHVPRYGMDTGQGPAPDAATGDYLKTLQIRILPYREVPASWKETTPSSQGDGLRERKCLGERNGRQYRRLLRPGRRATHEPADLRNQLSAGALVYGVEVRYKITS